MLADWIIGNIKNRDILFKKIADIKKNIDGFDFVIEYKDRRQCFIVMPDITEFGSIESKVNSEGHFALVTFNKKQNLGEIIRNWQKLAKFKNFCIYFVNPNSEGDKKWVIFPYTHDKISDGSSLAAGLNAMFEIVQPVI